MDFAQQLRDAERHIREDELLSLRAYKEGKGESPILYRAFGKATQTKDPEIFVASEESEDRFGDIIMAAGWKLDTYGQNPGILFAHDHSIPTIGISKRTWVEGKQLLFSPAWDMPDPFAALIAGKYERGIMRAMSVGFRALEMENRSTAKGEPAFVFKSQELLEISAVAVPAHPAALKKAISDSPGLRWLPLLYELPWLYEKPFPNEHACRLRDPGDFQGDSFRRMEREHEGKKYSVIMGRLTGETTMTEQAYRYPKDSWETAQARSHCRGHDGSFEPAEVGSESLDDADFSSIRAAIMALRS